MCLLYKCTRASAFENVYPTCTLSSAHQLFFRERCFLENVYLVERAPVRERFVERLHTCLGFEPLPYWVPAHPLRVLDFLMFFYFFGV